MASLKKLTSSLIDHIGFAVSAKALIEDNGHANTQGHEKRGFHLSHSEVFGVTRKPNKFCPRKARTFTELIQKACFF